MPGRAGAVSREYSPRGNANGVTFDVTIYFRIRALAASRPTRDGRRVLAVTILFSYFVYDLYSYRIGARYDGFGEDYRAARPQSEARSTRG